MSGFRRRQHGRSGFHVPHLADQDDVRGLAQDAAHGACKIQRIVADLHLLDDGVAVRVHVFDGSSMVTMWSRRMVLMASISTAKVELLPEPAAPVISTSPSAGPRLNDGAPA